MRVLFTRSKKTLCWIFVAAHLFLSAGCGTNTNVQRGQSHAEVRRDTANTNPASSVHLLLGNPSEAASDPANRDNYLIVGDAYALSYNNSKGTANWVSWKTTSQDLGDRLERPEFHPDDRLPAGFRHINTFDYSGSGYERGHLCPSADRFGDRDKNYETFAMTNIVPQTGDLNEFVWEKLESYSRALVRRGFDVYTVAGVYGEQSRLKGRVIAPTNCWKIIVVLRRGSGLADISEKTRIIAVDMPNTGGIADDDWQKYRTSVRAIEEKTGYDFFSSLPRELQDKLEIKTGDN